MFYYARRRNARFCLADCLCKHTGLASIEHWAWKKIFLRSVKEYTWWEINAYTKVYRDVNRLIFNWTIRERTDDVFKVVQLNLSRYVVLIRYESTLRLWTPQPSVCRHEKIFPTMWLKFDQATFPAHQLTAPCMIVFCTPSRIDFITSKLLPFFWNRLVGLVCCSATIRTIKCSSRNLLSRWIRESITFHSYWLNESTETVWTRIWNNKAIFFNRTRNPLMDGAIRGLSVKALQCYSQQSRLFLEKLRVRAPLGPIQRQISLR